MNIGWWCFFGLLLASAVSAQHEHLDSSRMMEDHFTSHSSVDPTVAESIDTDITSAAAMGSLHSVRVPVAQEPWKSTLPMAFGRDPEIVSREDCTGVDTGNQKCVSGSRDSSIDFGPIMSVVPPNNSPVKFAQAKTSGSLLKSEEVRGNELEVDGELSSKPYSPYVLNTPDVPEAPYILATRVDPDISDVTAEVPQKLLTHASKTSKNKGPNASGFSTISDPSETLNALHDINLPSPSKSSKDAQTPHLLGASTIPQVAQSSHTPGASKIQNAVQALPKPDESRTNPPGQHFSTSSTAGRHFPTVSNFIHAAEDLQVPGSHLVDYLTRPFISHSPHIHSRDLNVSSTPEYSNTTNISGATDIFDHQVSDVADLFSTFAPFASRASHKQKIHNKSSPPETPNHVDASNMVIPGNTDSVGVPVASNAPNIQAEAVPDAYVSTVIPGVPKILENLDLSDSPDVLGIPQASSSAQVSDVPWTQDTPNIFDAYAVPKRDYKFPGTPGVPIVLAPNSPKIPDASEVNEILPTGSQQSVIDAIPQQRDSLCPAIRVDRVTTFDFTFPSDKISFDYPRFLNILFRNKIAPNRANRRSMQAPIEIEEINLGNLFDPKMLTLPEIPEMRDVMIREEPQFQIEVRPSRQALKKIGFSSLISLDNGDRQDVSRSKQNNLEKSIGMFYGRVGGIGEPIDLRRLADNVNVTSRARKEDSLRGRRVIGKARGYPRQL